MAKEKSIYACTECGGTSPKWQGKCPSCGAWNTLVEAVEEGAARHRFATPSRGLTPGESVATLSEIEAADAERQPTGIDELDRALGGGLVAGGVVLIGGDPGIGKSTLLLQALDALSRAAKVLYVTGEESGAQVALRSRRLGLAGSAVRVMAEIQLEKIMATIEAERPAVCVGRFDPDRLQRSADLGAGLGGPGARVRRPAHPAGQGERDHRHPGRPCHQGRGLGRAARHGAHRRHRALFRGRHPFQLPPGAGDQEPVRRGQRDRRLRHDREGPQGRRQSERDLPLDPRRSGRRLVRAGRRSRARGRCWSRCRRWSIRAAQSAPALGRPRPRPAGDDAGGAASPRRHRRARPGRVRQRRRRGAHQRALRPTWR
jgi:hypothetical protein